MKTYQDGTAVGLGVDLVWGVRGVFRTDVCTYDKSMCPHQYGQWEEGAGGKPVGGLGGGCS